MNYQFEIEGIIYDVEARMEGKGEYQGHIENDRRRRIYTIRRKLPTFIKITFEGGIIEREDHARRFTELFHTDLSFPKGFDERKKDAARISKWVDDLKEFKSEILKEEKQTA